MWPGPSPDRISRISVFIVAVILITPTAVYFLAKFAVKGDGYKGWFNGPELPESPVNEIFFAFVCDGRQPTCDFIFHVYHPPCF